MKIWQTDICQAFFDLKIHPNPNTQNHTKNAQKPSKYPQKCLKNSTVKLFQFG